jgi:hypothetical protein
MPTALPEPSSPRPNRRARLGAVASLILALGYMDLARGGTVAAPLLLVAAYLVVVPAMLLTSRHA